MDKLDSCKGKENEYAEKYIKEIQDIYKQDNLKIKKPMVDDKEKQEIQEEVFLYKLYDDNLPRLKIPEPTFIQDEIGNLKKYIKYMQSSIKTIPFYLLPHYKFI